MTGDEQSNAKEICLLHMWFAERFQDKVIKYFDREPRQMLPVYRAVRESEPELGPFIVSIRVAQQGC